MDNLIRALSELSAEVRGTRVMVFQGGSVTNNVIIQFWSSVGPEDNQIAVVIDSC